MNFCIEPNPPESTAAWITTSAEGLRLVESVASEGFGLNLDAGGMTLANEDPSISIACCAHHVKHFHISEPRLAAVGASVPNGTNHDEFARALKSAGYSGWTSIEMLLRLTRLMELRKLYERQRTYSG